jgi:hypothetical protein
MHSEKKIIVPQKYLHKFTKAEINEFPIRHYDGIIYLIDSFEKMSEIKVESLLENENIFGFDTETQPSFKKGKTTRLRYFN